MVFKALENAFSRAKAALKSGVAFLLIVQAGHLYQ